MKPIIKTYYNQLAKEYDNNRFGNTYGQYIDQQEKAIVRKWLKENTPEHGLDLACGTGRFLEFAKNGLDISPEMIAVAKKKFPEHRFFESSATSIPFEKESLTHLLCFHLLMHLDASISRQIVEEGHRVLKENGLFILDIPSKHRRMLTNTKQENWHGANDFYLHDFKKVLSDDWTILHVQGIAFFPIHRLPIRLRKYFVFLDNLLCKSFLKKYASYLVFVLKKKSKL